jgi:predicted nuclease with TOPRIM domain
MEPPTDVQQLIEHVQQLLAESAALKQRFAAFETEHAALKERFAVLEAENAALKVRNGELELKWTPDLRPWTAEIKV